MATKNIKIRPKDDVKARCGGKKSGCHLTEFYIIAKAA
jgi:hypothetical protein